MIVRWALGLLCLLAPVALSAQTAPSKGSPSLTALANGIRDEAHARDIALSRLDIAVTLRGGIAETVVTAKFANGGKEPLEGDFRLALPADAVVTGYALDIKGRLLDGVLVDRGRAKAVYETAVRGRIDPGLAEVEPEGVFHTRVFPIPAKGSRTIRLRYVAPVFNAHRGEDVYVLPLDLPAPGEGWSISVRAEGVGAAPSLTWPGREPIAMAREGTAFVAREEDKRALNGPLILGRPALPEALASRNALGERFVQLSGTVPAGAADTAERVRIYWDRSRSRLGDHKDELMLLRRVLAGLKPREIEVVTFNSSGAERRKVASADAAIALLEGVRYRGATNFAPLAGDLVRADRCLLLTNGKSAVDRDAKADLPCRVDAITTSKSADMAWLRHFATLHGGRAWRLGDDIGELEKALVRTVPTVTAVLDDQGRRLSFVPIESSNGQWLVAARAPDRGGVRVLIGGTEQRRSVPEAADFAGESALIAVDTLATLGATERRADYVALSRRYGVASPSLSFLVLETPQDYVNADVAPPASYDGEDLASYRAARESADKEAAEAKQGRLEQVVGLWNEQVSWWQRKFDPMARPKRERDERQIIPSPAMSAPAPEPTPTPEPMPADDSDAIVVTSQRAPASEAAASPVTAVTAEDIGRFPDTASSGPRIEIDAWQPERPYLKAFDAAPARFDALFLEQEKLHGTLPAFYLDTAEWLRRHGRAGEAREMVLAALDLPVANEVTLGLVAARLERYGAWDRAIELREREAALDPTRPQPKRLLALALARRAEAVPAHARADLERAIALLSEVALTPWSDAWAGIETIALMEANALIPKLRALGGDTDLDRRLIALLDADIRVIAEWNTDATDLDLWVDEANGERAIYSHPRTAIGGHLSNDMTSGYGPEEYFIRRAPRGTYTIRANVFAGDRIDPNGPSVVTAHIIRNFGRPNQSDESVDIEVLGDDKEGRLIGRVVVGAKPK
ncbi:hypothetical protein J2W22_001480 [Sphingomonas kyeonggiensis]|uniref:VIT domain-containing protein n=1 Tax=Sphingomonas kyeonggiensis TaxID=1268553 RepID=UPI00278AA002|nr:VIT domain-containing protein [Sphingomonas kyeonggiensis]MDQ0249433.1 hypothetical protein [Sphingomonas kyeonggiensis]